MLLEIGISQLVASGVNFLIAVILARSLPVDDFGNVSIILFLIGILNTLGSSLITQPMLALVKGDDGRCFDEIFLIGLVFVVVSFLVGIIGGYYVYGFDSSLLTGGVVALFVLRDFARRLFVVLNKKRLLVIYELQYLLFTLTVSMLWLYSSYRDALNMLFLSLLLSSVLAVTYLTRFGLEKKWHITRSGFAFYINFARWNFGAGLVTVSVSSAFPLYLSVFYGSAFAAVLKAIQNVFGMLGMVGQFYEIWLQRKLTLGGKRILKYIYFVNFIVFVALSLFIVLFGLNFFEFLYGSLVSARVAEKSYLMYSLLILFSFSLFYSVEKIKARFMGFTRAIFFASILGSSILLVAVALAIYGYGEFIVVLAWVVSVLIPLVYLYFVNRIRT